jgi:hypothetical protein
VAFTFDSTVGGASANSYVTTTDFADYVGGRFDVAEYTAANATQIQQALAMATARLETESYLGTPTYTSQRLQWPRYWVPNPHFAGSGVRTPYFMSPVFDATIIPEPIKQATYELALMFLKDTTALSDTGLEGFADVAVGPLKVTPRHEHKAGALPAHVVRLLKGLRVSSGGSVPVIRG